MTLADDIEAARKHLDELQAKKAAEEADEEPPLQYTRGMAKGMSEADAKKLQQAIWDAGKVEWKDK